MKRRILFLFGIQLFTSLIAAPRNSNYQEHVKPDKKQVAQGENSGQVLLYQEQTKQQQINDTLHQVEIPVQVNTSVAVRAVVLARQFTNAWSISEELFKYIRNVLPEGSTILELGSGWGTGELAKWYIMYSVENDPKWLNKYNTHYIYAPIVNGWYDTKVLKKELPREYDLLLIDGPLATIGRSKFFDNIHLFNTNVTMIFDDVNRKPELDLFNKVAEYVKRPTIILSGNGKQFGVILPK